jgi:hypothetical protein
VGTNCNLLADSTINCQTKLLQDIQMSKTSKFGVVFAQQTRVARRKKQHKTMFFEKR